MKEHTLLEVQSLSVYFQMYRKGTKQENLQVISDLSVHVRRGEIVAVVGSSGSGKSLLADAILGLLPANAHTSGYIGYCGSELTKERIETLRGREIAYIPQSVLNLDPMMRIDKQVIGLYGTSQRQRELFAKYDLDPNVGKAYPHQLSGGMVRRVLIAGAIMNDAKLIIADEPTPGLSEQLAEQLMGNFKELADSGYGILLITHDLNLAIKYADRITVFYAGTTVETAKASDFREEDLLRHPYSKALWRAMPQNKFEPTAGTQPYAGNLPAGCVFADRCPMRTEACAVRPKFRTIREGEVCCHHAD